MTQHNRQWDNMQSPVQVEVFLWWATKKTLKKPCFQIQPPDWGQLSEFCRGMCEATRVWIAVINQGNWKFNHSSPIFLTL